MHNRCPEWGFARRPRDPAVAVPEPPRVVLMGVSGSGKSTVGPRVAELLGVPYVEGDDLVLTNFTGHPTIVVPFGERAESKHRQPGTIAFTGRLFGETELLALAHAFQQATDAHLRRPPLEEHLAAKKKPVQ